MNWWDVLRVRRAIAGRNAFELQLYTTDDLRRLYQGTDDDPIRLRDGIVSRAELVAEIRWRVFVDRWCYRVLFIMTVIAAFAAAVAAVVGLK